MAQICIYIYVVCVNIYIIKYGVYIYTSSTAQGGEGSFTVGNL